MLINQKFKKRLSCIDHCQALKTLPYVEPIDKQLEQLDCDDLAIRTGFQKPSPCEMKAAEFLKFLCDGEIQPQVSLPVFATLLSPISGCCVTKQTLAKRMNDTSETFIRHTVLSAVGSLKRGHRKIIGTSRALNDFKRSKQPICEKLPLSEAVRKKKSIPSPSFSAFLTAPLPRQSIRIP